MIVVDASVWVSHLSPLEINHAISRNWLKQLVKSGVVIAAPALLLVEVAGAIARRTGDSDLGRQAVEHILTTPRLHLVYADVELNDLAAELAADLRLRGADTMYVAVAHQLDIPLVSWDREHLERSTELITTYTPTSG